MIITTERLILRPWQETDAESLFEYAKDPAVGPIAGWPVHTSVSDSLNIIREVLSADETYAVCLKTDNTAIGCIGLKPPSQTHIETESEIGYWLGVPFWGNGYMPEAVRALQKHAFYDLGITAIWCGYYDGNEKSRHCMEKCGFVYHHTEKDRPYRAFYISDKGNVDSETIILIRSILWKTSISTVSPNLYSSWGVKQSAENI